MNPCLIHDHQGTQALILPEKGATVISLQKNGTEFLYCNPENLQSPERPRCGIPFLFPMFGRLKDTQYSWDGQTYSMDIHGFGHTSAWRIASQTENQLVLVLDANETTLSQYPFRFRVTLDFLMHDGALTIRQTYENRDTRPMPYNYGFHPYYLTQKLENLQIETHADTYIDFAKGPAPFGHGRVTVTRTEGALEAGGAFQGVCGPTTLINSAEGRKLTMTFDSSFHTHVLWTWAEMPFLCVEPVNGTADGLNTGNYMTLEPGCRQEAFLTLRPENL